MGRITPPVTLVMIRAEAYVFADAGQAQDWVQELLDDPGLAGLEPGMIRVENMPTDAAAQADRFWQRREREAGFDGLYDEAMGIDAGGEV